MFLLACVVINELKMLWIKFEIHRLKISACMMLKVIFYFELSVHVVCLNLFETTQNEFDGGNEWIRCCYVVGGRVIQYMFFVWSFYLFFFSITFSLDALISMFLLHISVYKKVFKFHIHTIQFPLVCVLCLFQKYMLWSFKTSY